MSVCLQDLLVRKTSQGREMAEREIKRWAETLTQVSAVVENVKPSRPWTPSGPTPEWQIARSATYPQAVALAAKARTGRKRLLEDAASALEGELAERKETLKREETKARNYDAQQRAGLIEAEEAAQSALKLALGNVPTVSTAAPGCGDGAQIGCWGGCGYFVLIFPYLMLASSQSTRARWSNPQLESVLGVLFVLALTAWLWVPVAQRIAWDRGRKGAARWRQREESEHAATLAAMQDEVRKRFATPRSAAAQAVESARRRVADAEEALSRVRKLLAD